MNLLITLLFISVIFFNAFGDGLNDSNRKVIGHIMVAIYIGLLLAMPFIINIYGIVWWAYILKYSFIRFGIFSPIYNLTRELPILYVGESSLDDLLYKWTKQSPGIFERIVFLVVGVFI
jgi:hypothetical protein